MLNNLFYSCLQSHKEITCSNTVNTICLERTGCTENASPYLTAGNAMQSGEFADLPKQTSVVFDIS